MSKLVGIGATKDSDSKKITLLKEQLEKIKEENKILNVEKSDLEKQLEKIKEENKILNVEKSDLEKQLEKLKKKNKKEDTKEKDNKQISV